MIDEKILIKVFENRKLVQMAYYNGFNQKRNRREYVRTDY